MLLVLTNLMLMLTLTRKKERERERERRGKEKRGERRKESSPLLTAHIPAHTMLMGAHGNSHTTEQKRKKENWQTGAPGAGLPPGRATN